MKYIFIFFRKLLFSIAYILKQTVQFLWEFNSSKLDFRICPSEFDEVSGTLGYHYKNLRDYWKGKLSQTTDFKLFYERNYLTSEWS